MLDAAGAAIKVAASKAALATLCACTMCALSLIPANLYAQAAAPAAGQAPAGPPMDIKGKTAAQFYKNIKVLNDIPAVEVHPAMEYIMVGLGVGCAYCHDVRHFDNDDKPQKRTARNMIQMTLALNSTVFDNQVRVTCFTCHRGLAIPAASPVLAPEKGPDGPVPAGTYAPSAIPNQVLTAAMAPVKVIPGATPPAATQPPAVEKPVVALPAADDLFSKYLQALGGNDALRKITTLVAKGTVEMALPPAPGTPPGPPTIGHPAVEVSRTAPDKALMTIQLPAKPNMDGYDGTTSWLQGQLSRENTGGERAVFQQWAEFVPGLGFRANHTRVHVDSIEKVGDHQAYRVSGFRIVGAGYDRVYFDTQSGLLGRTVTYMNSVLGSFPIQNDYDDYRPVNGIQVAFTDHYFNPEGNRLYKWEQVEANTPIDDKVYARPPQPPPPPPAPPAAK